MSTSHVIIHIVEDFVSSVELAEVAVSGDKLSAELHAESIFGMSSQRWTWWDETVKVEPASSQWCPTSVRSPCECALCRAGCDVDKISKVEVCARSCRPKTKEALPVR